MGCTKNHQKIPFLLKKYIFYFFHFFTLGDLRCRNGANFYTILVILYITMKKQQQKYQVTCIIIFTFRSFKQKKKSCRYLYSLESYYSSKIPPKNSGCQICRGFYHLCLCLLLLN